MPADCTVYNATTINWTNQMLGAVMEGPTMIKEMYFKPICNPLVFRIFKNFREIKLEISQTKCIEGICNAYIAS